MEGDTCELEWWVWHIKQFSHAHAIILYSLPYLIKILKSICYLNSFEFFFVGSIREKVKQRSCDSALILIVLHVRQRKQTNYWFSNICTMHTKGTSAIDNVKA